MKAVKESVVALLKVKSIVTIILTMVFAHLSITSVISGDQFLTVFSVVIAFYFGAQYQKSKGESSSEAGGK